MLGFAEETIVRLVDLDEIADGEQGHGLNDSLQTLRSAARKACGARKDSLFHLPGTGGTGSRRVFG
jgi:hypothetical protein